MNCAPVRHISRRFSIHHLWALVILTGVFVFINTHPIRPHDFWWHMAVGREILTSGQIPELDTFSYTASGTRYPSYQSFWLMDISLYLIYQLGGAALVVFFQSVIICSAYLLVLLTSLRLSHDWRMAAFGTGFAAVLGLNDWNVRPQTIAILFGAVFLFLIQHLRNGSRRGWALFFPLLMVVWVNSHGSYPIGLFFISLWLSQEIWDQVQETRARRDLFRASRIKFPALILLLSVLACLFNPAGIEVVKYFQNMWGSSIIQNLVTEWAAPTFDTLGGSIFLSALLLSALILAISPRRMAFYQILGYILLAFLALRTSRGIIWFGLAMGPILAEHTSAMWHRMSKNTLLKNQRNGSPVINWMFLVIIMLLAVLTLPWFKENLPLPAEKAGLISGETPIAAVEYIMEARPPGNVFHAMSFGSYLIWAAYPEYRVFVDGRIELFSEEIWQDYLTTSAAMGDWEGTLERYDVHTLLLSRDEQPELVNAVLDQPEWQLVFEDDAALVYVHH